MKSLVGFALAAAACGGGSGTPDGPTACTPHGAWTTAGGSRMMAARFTQNGAPDTCFDDDGIGFGITAESPAAVIDAMDRITMVGHQYADPINTRLVVARVAP
jgi:hypothetical protein